jgi:hypothetical protein
MTPLSTYMMLLYLLFLKLLPLIQVEFTVLYDPGSNLGLVYRLPVVLSIIPLVHWSFGDRLPYRHGTYRAYGRSIDLKASLKTARSIHINMHMHM